MRLTLKTLSIVFDYPGDEFKELVQSRDVVKPLLEGEDSEAASLISSFLDSINLNTVDEEYTAVFEVPPKCSLYAHAYLLKGKEDLVGQLLLEVKAQYKVKGYDVPVSKEIPTYLPAMLEFLAFIYDSDKEATRRFAKKYLAPWARELRACLEKNGSKWALPARALEIVVSKLTGL